MSRLDPKNMEEALCHQLDDDVKRLMLLAKLGDGSGFESLLSTVKVRIQYYEKKAKKIKQPQG